MSPTTSTSKTNAFILVTSMRLGVPVRLSQHADEHRTERPVFFAVNQQLGEGAALRVALELSDPVGSLEVGEHQDVEKLGAESGTEGGRGGPPEPALELVGLTAGRLRRRTVGPRVGHRRLSYIRSRRVTGVTRQAKLGRCLNPAASNRRASLVRTPASSGHEDGSDDRHADAHCLQPEAHLQRGPGEGTQAEQDADPSE